jgi:hypothetical protein
MMGLEKAKIIQLIYPTHEFQPPAIPDQSSPDYNTWILTDEFSLESSKNF